MSLIEWNKSIEVGNPEIDAEHKIFVSIIQRIEAEISTNGNKEYIINLVKELLKYVEFHFCSEENMMIREEYPDYLWHKKIHSRLIVELKDRIYILKYEYIDFQVLLKFLITWFKQHTSKEDLNFAKFLNSRGL